MTDVLLQFGVSGAMLWWFARRMEIRMERLTAAVDRLTRTSLIQTLNSSHNKAVKAQAQMILNEFDNSAAANEDAVIPSTNKPKSRKSRAAAAGPNITELAVSE